MARQRGFKQTHHTMKKNTRKNIAPMAAFILTCATIHAPAWAQSNLCTSIFNGSSITIIPAKLTHFNVPAFNPGPIPIGQRIGDVHTSQLQSFTGQTECPGYTNFWYTGVGAPGPFDTYPTSVPGIGVRLSTQNSNGKFFPYDTRIILYNGGIVYWKTHNQTFNFELIKTGPITKPGRLQGPFLYYRNGKDGQILVEYQLPAIDITPSIPTCSVKSSSIEVPFGKFPSSQLKGINSVSSRLENFNIRLACTGGDPQTSIKAFALLTDAINPGNTSKILTVQKTGLPGNEIPTTGIGIQILQNGDPKNLGPDLPNAANTNRWPIGTIKQGDYDIVVPLQARLVQTAAKVTAGKLYARATFTISYE